MSDDDFEGLENFLPELLPDGSVPMSGVLVIEYVSHEGDTEHAVETLGDIRIVEALGLFEVGKVLILEDAEEDA